MKACLSLLLLLLGLSQASPLLGQSGDSLEGSDDDDLDIGSRILNANKDTSELLLEGDVLLPKARNAMRCWWGDYCRWSKSSDGLVTIPYTLSRDFSSWQKTKIERAMESFSNVSCIRFVPRQKEYSYISVVNGEGCYSYYGRIGGAQHLSLNRYGCVHHGIIQHELLHALGFKHEHARSDRDQYVKINWDNIDPDKQHNFQRAYTNNLDTDYDYSSVMHYGKKAFSMRWNLDSITPIPDPEVSIGQRDGMTATDIRRINLLYGC